MPTTAILIPVFALAGWTCLILLLIAFRRLTAGVAPREYALGDSSQVPLPVQLANRNYMNLLELPLLFYIICLLAYVTGSVSGLLVLLAWSYVLLRVVHSVIHVTYNQVMHRFLVFVLSNLVLTALWVLVGLTVF